MTVSGAGDGPADAAGPTSLDRRLSGRRILVVEDEAMLALDLEFAFEDAGAHVIGPAVSLDQALSLVSGVAGIDAAVLDVDIAGRPVIPVAQALSAAGVPFVFHTGHGDRIDLLARFPGARLLMKPVLTERLVAEVVSLLG
ncbi:response regulator [Parablastomonas sp. CN1-191]|uniref:response regulator n=1 Tax=Parablastomonas sp. CN1-191 TaxID=3400908 RepID=UPI003BF7F4DE